MPRAHAARPRSGTLGPVDEPGDYLRRVGGVHAFQWNPLREVDGETQLLNNFGDLLGPVVVELVLESIAPGTRLEQTPERRVVSVGSVMHFARPRDVVWGTGINGKVTNARVHGERGPQQTFAATVAYLRAEQSLGRASAEVDADAVAGLLFGGSQLHTLVGHLGSVGATPVGPGPQDLDATVAVLLRALRP